MAGQAKSRFVRKGRRNQAKTGCRMYEVPFDKGRYDADPARWKAVTDDLERCRKD